MRHPLTACADKSSQRFFARYAGLSASTGCCSRSWAWVETRASNRPGRARHGNYRLSATQNRQQGPPSTASNDSLTAMTNRSDCEALVSVSVACVEKIDPRLCLLTAFWSRVAIETDERGLHAVVTKQGQAADPVEWRSSPVGIVKGPKVGRAAVSSECPFRRSSSPLSATRQWIQRRAEPSLSHSSITQTTSGLVETPLCSSSASNEAG